MSETVLVHPNSLGKRGVAARGIVTAGVGDGSAVVKDPRYGRVEYTNFWPPTLASAIRPLRGWVKTRSPCS